MPFNESEREHEKNLLWVATLKNLKSENTLKKQQMLPSVSVAF